MSDGRCKGKHEGNALAQCSLISQTKQIPYLHRVHLRCLRHRCRHVTQASQLSVTVLSAEHARAKSACLHPTSGHPPTSRPCHRRVKCPDRTATPRREPCAAPRKAVSRCGYRIWPTPSTAYSATRTSRPPTPAASTPATFAATAPGSWRSFPQRSPPRHSQLTDTPSTQAGRKPAMARLFSPCPTKDIPHDAGSVSFRYDHADSE